jgi:hypothetical protein
MNQYFVSVSRKSFSHSLGRFQPLNRPRFDAGERLNPIDSDVERHHPVCLISRRLWVELGHFKELAAAPSNDVLWLKLLKQPG